jgi:hypothetical protein
MLSFELDFIGLVYKYNNEYPHEIFRDENNSTIKVLMIRPCFL